MATLQQQYLRKFGENLRKVREAKGISQRSLATSCNVDASHISKIERGEKNITILTIIELAHGLEIKPKRLWDFDID